MKGTVLLLLALVAIVSARPHARQSALPRRLKRDIGDQVQKTVEAKDPDMMSVLMNPGKDLTVSGLVPPITKDSAGVKAKKGPVKDISLVKDRFVAPITMDTDLDKDAGPVKAKSLVKNTPLVKDSALVKAKKGLPKGAAELKAILKMSARDLLEPGVQIVEDHAKEELANKVEDIYNHLRQAKLRLEALIHALSSGSDSTTSSIHPLKDLVLGLIQLVTDYVVQHGADGFEDEMTKLLIQYNNWQASGIRNTANSKAALY